MEDLNKEITPLKRIKKTKSGLIATLEDELQNSKNMESIICPVCSIKINYISDVDPQVHINQCLDLNSEFELGPCSDSSGCLMFDVDRFSKYSHKIEKNFEEYKPFQSNFLNEAFNSKTSFLLTNQKRQVCSLQKSMKFKQSQINQYFKSDKKSTLCKVSNQNVNDNIVRSAFSGANSAVAKKQKIAQQPRKMLGTEKNLKKECPFYKKICGTSISVDAFCYGDIPGCKYYLLSHFHSDHYKGLSKSFSGKLYCSKITANLVVSQLNVCQENVIVLPMYQTVNLGDVQVTLFDANHCPGSVMFFFEFHNKRILHVGDFRVHSNMLRNEKIGEAPINELYLDTTYCDPKYTFPPQNDVIDFVVKTARKFLEENKQTLIVCGTYTIGKEKVFHSLANELGLKIGVTKEKMKILKCLEDKDLENKLSLDYNLAQIHVLPLFSINLKKLSEHIAIYKKCGYERILAFKPTGWTFNASFKTVEDISPLTRGNITTYGVPYSEHSSFAELKSFVQVLRPKKIIPTVNNGSQESRYKMAEYFKSWLT